MPRLELDDSKVKVGGWAAVSITGMSSGWQAVTVTSPALKRPIRLTPRRPGASESKRYPYGTGGGLREEIPPWTYPMTATSDGRVVASANLTVTAPAPAEITRFVAGRTGTPLGVDDATPKVVVRPGVTIVVLLADVHAARNEDALTVKSPAFRMPLTIKTDSPDDPGCKCTDGTTVYAGHTALRPDLPAGTYRITVTSHHGQNTSTAELKVAGPPEGRSRPWLITGAVVLVLAGAGFTIRRSRRSKNVTPAP